MRVKSKNEIVIIVQEFCHLCSPTQIFDKHIKDSTDQKQTYRDECFLLSTGINTTYVLTTQTLTPGPRGN